MSRAVQDNASDVRALKAAKGEPATEPEGQVWDTADDESESESDPGPEAEVSEKRGQHPVCCICRASSKDRDAFCCWSDGVLCSSARAPAAASALLLSARLLARMAGGLGSKC